MFWKNFCFSIIMKQPSMNRAVISILFLVLMTSCSKNSDSTETDNNLKAVVLPDHFQVGTIKGDTVLFYLPYGTNLTNVRVTFALTSSQSLSVDNNSLLDISIPLMVIVSEGGSKRKYVLKAVVPRDKPVAVQGVWVSNVGSNALSSADNIEQTVKTIDELGFNAAFVVVYNKSKTLHRSEVLKEVLGAATAEENMIYPGFDALGTFIEKAHAKGIKVIAWFEYGFASHYTGMPNPILVAKPQWAALDMNGNITLKNNFYWLNGYHPEVRQYMAELIAELVSEYDVDGVQGDDRLPAMPVNSGYDSYTRQLYQAETGREAPSSDSDGEWMQWRANKLTDFGERLYDTVRSIRPACIVSWAPSTSGWSYQNYLQQWDKWLERDIVDIISPQLYRYESQGIKAYTDLVDKELRDVINKSPGYKARYFPAILLKSGSYVAGETYIADCIKYNRSKGIQGEVMFYYDGIEANRRVFRAFYPVKASFPQH